MLVLLLEEFLDKSKSEETMQHLKELADKAKSAINSIENNSLVALDEIRVEYFGKKGHFTQLMQELRNIAAEERPIVGAKINEVKQLVLEFLNTKKAEWEQAELNAKLEKERIDVTLPGKKIEKADYTQLP
ncbi:phenylalanyl-tRNA synthase alpha chain [Rodentibacter pneumotropicus]|uniref:Phenylalanyl-tRNA synthase alpha chain n=1 Tax=Rodentibacter pneumotropicus TaxID=758 RepID=A0A3S4U9D6_9PAST|nr:phenylalanyl-tRNA synthase alpha chain [Rodentibacter pneumotropicus]